MKTGHRRHGFNYWLIYFYTIQSSVYSVWRGTDGRSLCSRAAQHTAKQHNLISFNTEKYGLPQQD